MRRSFALMTVAAMLVASASANLALAQDTLYQQLGGKDGIVRIASGSVDRFVADDRVKDDFDNINLDRLKKRLADELCQLAGGPCIYKGRPMAASHAELGVNRAKFNAVAEDLQAEMQALGIPYWTQNRLMALLAPMQRDIVTR